MGYEFDVSRRSIDVLLGRIEESEELYEKNWGPVWVVERGVMALLTIGVGMGMRFELEVEGAGGERRVKGMESVW